MTVYKRTSTPPLRYSLGMYTDVVLTGPHALWGVDTCVFWDIPKIRELQAGEQKEPGSPVIVVFSLPLAHGPLKGLP